MPPLSRPLFAAALAVALLAPPTALADDPSPEQRVRIEAALRAMGYASWDDIDLKDGGRVVEVDDARHADGREYDLKLNAADLSVIEREPD